MRFDCKADNVRAMREGLFGNAPEHWETLSDVLRDCDPHENIVARPRVKGGECFYHASYNYMHHQGKMGVLNPRDYYYNRPIDPMTVTLNAEVMQGPCGPFLFYSTAPEHMRPALRFYGKHARGAVALAIMRHFLCDRGREAVFDLMTDYPEHVIEFTCMDREYGTLRWRTVVWEVRNY